MTPMQFTFILIAAVTLVSAVMAVTARRMMHAALWLIATLMGVAMLFATLQASFFAVVQVMVYVGAIAILILFAIMLTRRSTLESDQASLGSGWIINALAAVGVFAALVTAVWAWPAAETVLTELPKDAEQLGLLGQIIADPNGFAVPFEVSSVLLVAVLVGAIYLAVERKPQRGGRQ
ncbi:MAG TPA: NADH-quinone oxidoreductase subunit J [Anaerolineaceae bacterium]|nr:NADH-quinone oxidoreductase subunit J [Anaerolineaceae bacterium]